MVKNEESKLVLNFKIPHGILFYGPPGTGKTLLARAIAFESGAHLEMISGSAFHEMFVGVGSSRARDLFSRAEKNQPSIIILDEADSAAPARASGIQQHEESIGLVNQLLSLLDRVEKEDLRIFLIAITNRPDMLDPAFLRAGRLDRHIEVPLPNLEGRTAILKIHLTRPKAKPIDFDVNDIDGAMKEIAKEIPGFSGADIAALTNEAAIRAWRDHRKVITIEDFRQSVERVLMGPVKKLKINKKEMELIAYHEAGHALTAMLLPETDPIHIVTILPHGRSLGYTRLLPETEYHVTSRTRIFNQIQYGLGGRAAEEICFNERSTGASGDISAVIGMARAAVCAYGMSDKLGIIGANSPVNAFYDFSLWSEWMRAEVDREVMALINEDCYSKTVKLLKENRDKLKDLAEALLKSEKKRLLGSEIYEMFPDLKPKQAVDS